VHAISLSLAFSWRDVADRGVKAHGVIVLDEAADQATGVLETQGDSWAALAQFPVYDGERATVEQRAEMEETSRCQCSWGASGCTKPLPLSEGFGFQESKAGQRS
jgi:hypothetical protein